MGPKRNVLFQTHLLFVAIYGLICNSSVKLLTYDGAGQFDWSPFIAHSTLCIYKEKPKCIGLISLYAID